MSRERIGLWSEPVISSTPESFRGLAARRNLWPAGHVGQTRSRHFQARLRRIGLIAPCLTTSKASFCPRLVQKQRSFQGKPPVHCNCSLGNLATLSGGSFFGLVFNFHCAATCNELPSSWQESGRVTPTTQIAASSQHTGGRSVALQVFLKQPQHQLSNLVSQCLFFFQSGRCASNIYST